MSVNFKTREEVVTDQLRDMIIEGKFQTGERLQQDDLALELGVSRIPIRSALRTLEAEGLVKFKPHKGVEIITLSADELVELYDIRVMCLIGGAKRQWWMSTQ